MSIVKKVLGGCVVLMRPVPARRACLACHAEAKAGDTLGVMVYSVRKTKRGEVKSIGMR